MLGHRSWLGAPASLVFALGLLLGRLPVPALAASPAPLLASGVMRDAHGAAVAGTVAAWFEDAGHGQWLMAAAAVAGNDGRFELRAALQGALRRAAARNDGWLNLLLAGGTSEQQGSVAITRQVRGGAWAGPHGSLRVALVADAPVSAGQRQAIDRFTAATRAAAHPDTAAAYVNLYQCYPTDAQTWKGYTVIGELHTWADETATWSYGRTADSDIGVGISYNGTAWRQSGSFHVGTSASSSVAKTAGGLYGRLLKSRFEYQKLHWVGYCPFFPAYTITPLRWLSGLVEGADVRQYDGYCGSYYGANAAEFGPNTTWTRDRNDYATFGGAVSAFGLVGLSAQSGLSTDVRMTHTFGAGHFHRLCGNDDDIIHASRVFAG